MDSASYRLERRVADAVTASGTLRAGERALLMLSGGADSMALLAIVRAVDRRLRLGLALEALHVDYSARGAASDRDREIVVHACCEAGVPLDIVKLTSRLEGPGFQARARDLRYGRAREVAEAHGCGVIVTAHNRDDQAETVLYRLVKYASPRGLAGMRPREGDISRPLLVCGAGEIREYCRRCDIEYGEDASNATRAYARNRLRLDVLPALEVINPRVAETLADSAVMAAAEGEVLAAATAVAATRVVVPAATGELEALDVRALVALPPALASLVVHDVIRRARGGDALVERRLVDAVLALASRRDDAGRVSLGCGLEAVRSGGLLRLRLGGSRHACTPVTMAGAELAAAGAGGLAPGFCGRDLRVRLLEGAVLDLGAAARGGAYVGLDAVPGAVTLRHPRRGERFGPLGLAAETTVARFLAAAGADAEARSRALLVDVDGAAAWVGYERGGVPAGRVAHGYRVHESKPYTLHVSLEGK